MKSGILLSAALIIFFVCPLLAQKSKKKDKKPDLQFVIDSLAQRLSESQRRNEKLVLEKGMLEQEVDKNKKETKDLNLRISELEKKNEEQKRLIKKLYNDIIQEIASKKAATYTSIEFETMEADFGEIKEGEKVTKIYKLTNTGKKRLMIEKVEGSCGCTVAEWPNYPVEPGKQAEIKVVFNSLGKMGPQNKTVTVRANTDPEESVLVIKGVVKEK